MGFQIPERRTATLTFENIPGWEKAEVRVLIDAPLETVLWIEESGTNDDIPSRDVFEVIANEILLDWNLEDKDGKPIPSNIEGMLKVPRIFTTMFMGAYYRQAAEVPAPLGEPSPNGKPSQGESIQELANSSESLPVSNGHVS